MFFRSLHTFVRMLPAYQLKQRLKDSNGGLLLNYRLRKDHVERFDEISYGAFVHNVIYSDKPVLKFAVSPSSTQTFHSQEVQVISAKPMNLRIYYLQSGKMCRNETCRYHCYANKANLRALSLSVQYRSDCAIQAKYATVKDALGLESAIDDWQISRLSRKSLNRTEDMEWPLTVSSGHP